VGDADKPKIRRTRAAVAGVVTFGICSWLLIPLALGLRFRDGTTDDSKVTDHGPATITHCETQYYGLEYKCTATVRWAPDRAPVSTMVWSDRELSGEVQVEKRQPNPRYKGTSSPEVVPVGYPYVTAASNFVVAGMLVGMLGPAGLAMYLGGRPRPVPAEPPGSADLRAAQLARGKARRRRRKTTG
jgi:hypothetical protein